jgi:hypothetical protein
MLESATDSNMQTWAAARISGSKKVAARATSRHANMIDFYARRCRSSSRRAAARQRCSRLTRRALRAHRFGGCSLAHRGDALLSTGTLSDARRSTTGQRQKLRLLGRELARAEQLPPPRPPRPNRRTRHLRARKYSCKREKCRNAIKVS